MADGAITITIDDAEVRAGLGQLVARLAHMTPVMEDIGRALGNLTEDAFQAQGPGWPALRPVTVKRRGNAGPILQVSGGSGLAGSITHGGDATSAWVGASKVYAAAQQFGMPKGYAGKTKRGSPIPWGDLPPRPYLPIQDGGLTPAAQQQILAILKRAPPRGFGRDRAGDSRPVGGGLGQRRDRRGVRRLRGPRRGFCNPTGAPDARAPARDD